MEKGHIQCVSSWWSGNTVRWDGDLAITSSSSSAARLVLSFYLRWRILPCGAMPIFHGLSIGDAHRNGCVCDSGSGSACAFASACAYVWGRATVRLAGDMELWP